jgi:hypothetical protein
MRRPINVLKKAIAPFSRQDSTVVVTAEASPATGIPGTVSGLAFRSSWTKPLCRVQKSDKFNPAGLFDKTIHHLIVQSGKSFECPT